MKIGICLCGGGAKGAYQAGVIKALYDKGIKFSAISGTSIGAINGYYIFTGNVEKLEDVWINMPENNENDIKIVDNTVDNSDVIETLRKLENKNTEDIDVYVNYIQVKNAIITEKIANLLKIQKEDGLNAIKYSSLLPCNPQGTLDFKNQFKKDLINGIYDGCNLDGGIVNNTLIEPLLKKDLNKLIIIATDKDYILSDEIKKHDNANNIIVIKPNTKFESKSILRFEREFCKNAYLEGYEIGKKVNISM